MSCCSASSCMKICFFQDNRVKIIKYGRTIKYRLHPNHKEWWSLGSFMRAKVFCRIIIAFCTYCCIFRVEKKPPNTTQQTLPPFRLGLRQSVPCIVLGLCLTFMVLCLSLWAETQFAPSPLPAAPNVASEAVKIIINGVAFPWDWFPRRGFSRFPCKLLPCSPTMHGDTLYLICV